MKHVYISTNYDNIYGTCGMAYIILNNFEVSEHGMHQYFDISELDSELTAFVTAMEKANTFGPVCIIFKANTIRKYGIKNIKEAARDPQKLKWKFKELHDKLEGGPGFMMDFTGKSDFRHKFYVATCAKLSKFALMGMTDESVWEYCMKYPKKSYDEINRKIRERRNASMESYQLKRDSVVKMKRELKEIFVITKTGPYYQSVDYCTFDEEAAKLYTQTKNSYFGCHQRAIDTYEYVIRDTKKKPNEIDRYDLSKYALSIDAWKKLVKETENGKYNQWFVEKVSIK